MKTRWMMAGGLLTLAALAVIALLGGAVLAQQNGDEAAPETEAAQDAVAPSGAAQHMFALLGQLGDDQPGQFKGHLSELWQHGDDGDHGPLARLAEIIGITPDELWAAINDGQSLAQIAAANGLSRQALVDALLGEAEQGLALAAGIGLLDDEQMAFLQDWLADGVALAVDHPLPVGQEWWGLGAYDWHVLLDAEDFDLPERLAGLLGLSLQELVQAVLDGSSLAQVAEANAVAAGAVVDFLVAEAQEELDEALAAGYLTDQQAQVLRGWVQDGVARVVDNPFMLPHAAELLERLEDRFGAHFGAMDWEKWVVFDWAQLVGQDPLSVAAEAVAVSRGELLEALMEGRSLAEIAAAQGVETEVVVDAQTEAVSAVLDSLAEQGLISAQELDFIKPFLGQGMRMLADHDFPFGEGLGKRHDGWPFADGEGGSWLKEWLDRCPCDADKSGE